MEKNCHGKRCRRHSGVDCLIHILDSLCRCECGREVEGCITLNQGRHEITVLTKAKPEAVFLSVRPSGGPVCVGDIDMVGSALLPDGFVLYADIRSAVAEVCYLVDG